MDSMVNRLKVLVKSELLPSWLKRKWFPYLSVVVFIFSAAVLVLLVDTVPRTGTDSGKGTAQAQVKDSTKKPKSVEKPNEKLYTLAPGDIPLLKSLQERQARLDALLDREKKLDEREESIRLIQKQIEEKLVTLQTLRKEITSLLKEKDNFEERRYEHLVKVYEGMKPSEAASLVERLQEHTAIQLLARMKSKKVSQILGEIQPENAARLSERLATVKQQKSRGKAK